MSKTTLQSTINGKAYEYACVLALKKLLHSVREYEVVENSSLAIAKARYAEISPKDQEEMLLSATAGIQTIIDMEPRILEDGQDVLTISLQPDNVAVNGDIRDVLIIRRNIEWEIGISVKHNHAALKHSRLSSILDFGKAWFGLPCSATYFEDICPIFDMLLQYKNDKKLWSEIPNKENVVYIPILNAFMREFKKLYSQHEDEITTGLIKYLLGSNGKDYYKLIHYNNHTARILPFNINGTLNQAATNKNPKIICERIDLPTKIIDLSYKDNSSTTIHLTMDNGWAISFRIHNASSRVETSLKFDIQLLGQPAELFYLDVRW